MKVGDLKTLLQSRGLDSSGLKADLIQRLEDSMKTSPTTKPAAASPLAAPAPAAAAAASSSSSPASAKKPSSLATTEHKATAASPAPPASTSSPSTASSAASSSLAVSASSPAVPIIPTGNAAMDAEMEARRRRAEKFGTEVKLSDEDKRKLREARFGPVAQPPQKKQKTDAAAAPAAPAAPAAVPAGNGGADDAKLSKRAEKFGTAAAKGQRGCYLGSASRRLAPRSCCPPLLTDALLCCV